MKANEFVKEVGWDVARRSLDLSSDVAFYIDMKLRLAMYQSDDGSEAKSDFYYTFNRKDLERLIESHDIVANLDRKQLFVLGRQLGTSSRSMRIIQAFKDVEACNEKPQ